MELTGLDKIVWKPGWKVTASSERSEKISNLIKREKWIIDGVSRDVLEAADTIIFLDFSRRVSYWRILKRNWKYLFWSRPELPNHCPEILIINRLTKIVWDFPSKIRPFILKHMKENENIKNVFHVRSSNDLKKLIDLISLKYDLI